MAVIGKASTEERLQLVLKFQIEFPDTVNVVLPDALKPKKAADSGNKYTTYTDEDMIQLLARINDVTENPARPWIVEDFRKGRNQWVYYCNTDWYHELYNDRHPVTSHSVSISGGNKDVKYYISGGYDHQTGVVKVNPDVFQKYNLRSKLDFKINKYSRLSNNTSFYSSTYDWIGAGDVEDSFAYASRHALMSWLSFYCTSVKCA